jgi:signal transduction histidine kinase
VDRVRGFLQTRGLDALVVVAAAWGAVGTALRTDQGHPTGLGLALEVAAVAAIVLGLLLGERFPFGAPATLWTASAALSFLDGRLVPGQPALFVAGLYAAILLGNQRNAGQSRIGLAIVLLGAAIVVYHEPRHDAGDFAFTPLVFVIGWLLGYALRERTERTEAAEERASRAEREREVAARIAVAEERTRIARELHDVVAHAVSVMVLQVGAVRHRMPASDTENREALNNVELAGRGALAEMRRLLGAMRREEDEAELVPRPGLADLPALLDDVRATGLVVGLEIHGEPVDLSAGLDLSAYRIVQEALTNVLKHADAGRADVALTYAPAELCIEVVDNGRTAPAPAGFGHGLVGIGERVKIYGGDLRAGRGEQGGWVLRARLPLKGETS